VAEIFHEKFYGSHSPLLLVAISGPSACVIMHNVIVEDEGIDEDDFNYDDMGEKGENIL